MGWSSNQDKSLSRLSADQAAASRFGQMQAERRKAIKEGRVRAKHQVWVKLAPTNQHLSVHSDYQFKDISKKLPDARWHDIERVWRVPATHQHLDAIRTAFSDQKYVNRFNPGRDKPVEVRVFPEVEAHLGGQTSMEKSLHIKKSQEAVYFNPNIRIRTTKKMFVTAVGHHKVADTDRGELWERHDGHRYLLADTGIHPLATLTDFNDDKVVRAVLVGSQIPKTKQVTRTVVETDEICPHCNEIIREKSLFYDGKNWFHRGCQEHGPIGRQ